ncbi:MAG: cytoskeleton protein RodZ [Synergistaceae bacterium]|nr:cytoskeleton protein RodZ [Synergistaceae bacterium]
MTIEELGNILVQRREKLGKSIDDAARETKIRVDYLKALEDGQMDQLPDRVFARGFIRQYLHYLRAEDLWPQYNVLLPLNEETIMTAAQPLGTYLPPPKGFRRTSLWWLYLLLLLIIVVAFYLVWTQRENIRASVEMRISMDEDKQAAFVTPAPQSESQTPTVQIQGQAPTREEAASMPASADVLGNISSVLEKIESEAKKDVETEEPIASQGELVITASRGRCWVRVRQGDRVIFTGTLMRGDSKAFTVSGDVEVRYGNAGAVDVSWLGERLASPGAPGGVVTVVYKMDGSAEAQR